MAPKSRFIIDQSANYITVAPTLKRVVVEDKNCKVYGQILLVPENISSKPNHSQLVLHYRAIKIAEDVSLKGYLTSLFLANY